MKTSKHIILTAIIAMLTLQSTSASVIVDGLTIYSQNITDTVISLEANTATSGLSGDAVFVNRVNANSNGQNSNIGLNLGGFSLATVGDTFTFSFDFRYTSAPTGFLRVALFDNGAQGPITADGVANWQTSGDKTYYTLSEWNGSQRWGLREEDPNTSINNVGTTIAGLTDSATGSYGTGVHTYTLSLERTAGGLQITNTIVDSAATVLVNQSFLDVTPYIAQVDGSYIRFDSTEDLYIGNFTAVPEPSTYALLAGLAMFGLVLRRSRNRNS